MLRLDGLRLFAAIVQDGSLTAAGRRLGMSKSLVSERLRELEEAVGARLMLRSARALALTDAGEAFYRVTQGVLADLDEAVDALAERKGSVCGSVRIAAPLTFGLKRIMPVLTGLLERHPQLAFDVDLNDRFVDLANEGFDLAVRIGDLANSTLVARRLGESRRLVVASWSYADRHKLPSSAEELEAHPAIAYANSRATHEWQFKTPDGQHVVVRPQARLRVNNGEAQLQAVMAGVGLAILPAFIVEEHLAAGRLVHVKVGMDAVPDPIHGLFLPNRHLARRVRTVIDSLAEALGRMPR